MDGNGVYQALPWNQGLNFRKKYYTSSRARKCENP